MESKNVLNWILVHSFSNLVWNFVIVSLICAFGSMGVDFLVQNYFGCFFSLPIVITSMRWGIAAGRKTMVCDHTFEIDIMFAL